MAIRYYPKNRVSATKYTSGGELVVNGQDYAGYYYETYDGKTFTGKGPTDITGNIPAIRVTDKITETREPRSFEEEYLRPLISIVPVPTMQDYKRGYFIRYFGKKTDNSGGIIEISKKNYQRMKQGKTGVEDYLYEVTDLFWKLTGPLNDDRTDRQYPIAGIVDTNKRLVETKEKSFSGIKAHINGKYTKFAIPS